MPEIESAEPRRPDAPAGTDGDRPGLRRARSALAALAVLGVFAVHFRPWQGGLLEDWTLAYTWDVLGVGSFWALLPSTLGRPLHLVPQYLGMMLSNGGFVGPYAVLGLAAVAQLAAAVWALRPIVGSASLRWCAAIAIALHPWWTPGDVLRFLPAQVAVLGTVVWLGASVRYLRAGQRRWAAVVVLAPALGLLTYQAPTAALMIGAVVLAMTTATTRARRAWLVGLTVGTGAAVMAWSVVVVPRINPDSYEAQLAAAELDLVASVRAVLRTLVLHGWSAIALALAVGLIVLVLALRRRLDPVHAAVLLVGLAGAPLAVLVYASQASHLNDPERVVLPFGLTVWLVLSSTLPALAADRVPRVVASAALLVGSVAGALVGYGTWTSYATAQQELLAAVQEVRSERAPDAQIVVVDESGRYGDVYLLLPPHLNYALDVQYGEGADAVLCTADGVVRDQPTAALYPLSTTPDCSTVLGPDPEALGKVSTQDEDFMIFEVEPAG